MTGPLILWDSRAVAQARIPCYLNTLRMLDTDAGFLHAGSRLAEQAENSVDKRRAHRTWVHGSMATALTSIAIK